MDIEYLEKADADQSRIFDRTIETYAYLETKAKYVASAFIAILTAYVSVVIAEFGSINFWQQAALVGLSPALFCTFYHLVDALKARDYQEGFLIQYEASQSPTKASYLSQKTKVMQTQSKQTLI